MNVLMTDPRLIKGGSIMQSACIPTTITEDGAGDFIDRVLDYFSHWSFDIFHIHTMLEICGDENERLDLIEDCLRKFGKLEFDPEEYPWHTIPENISSCPANDSAVLECNSLLNELDEVRLRVKGGSVYGK